MYHYARGYWGLGDMAMNVIKAAIRFVIKAAAIVMFGCVVGRSDHAGIGLL